MENNQIVELIKNEVANIAGDAVQVLMVSDMTWLNLLPKDKIVARYTTTIARAPDLHDTLMGMAFQRNSVLQTVQNNSKIPSVINVEIDGTRQPVALMDLGSLMIGACKNNPYTAIDLHGACFMTHEFSEFVGLAKKAVYTNKNGFLTNCLSTIDMLMRSGDFAIPGAGNGLSARGVLMCCYMAAHLYKHASYDGLISYHGLAGIMQEISTKVKGGNYMFDAFTNATVHGNGVSNELGERVPENTVSRLHFSSAIMTVAESFMTWRASPTSNTPTDVELVLELEKEGIKVLESIYPQYARVREAFAQ